MKNRTFKELILSLFLASTLILLTGCGGGGGGGSASGGYGYFIANNDTNSSDNNSSNNNSSNNNSSVNNSSDNDSPDNNSSDDFAKIPLSFSYKGETKKVPMNLGQSWKIDTSMAKSNDSINVNPASGEGNGEFIEITIPENTTNSPKNIKIPVINSEGTEQIASIVITQQSSKKKAWLFVNYFACDNDLVNVQFESLNAIEKVGSDDNTHVIAFYDIGNRAHISNDDKYADIITEDEWPGGVREFYLMSDTTDKITSPVIKYYEELDTDSANPLQLVDFLSRIIEQYPAEKICINIINHGGAYTGIINDETISADYGNSSSMQLPILQYALQKVYEKTGKKIDLLMLDACLMANFETAYQFKDYVSYIFASEEESLATTLDGLNGSANYYDFLTETSSSSVLSSEIKKIQKGLKSKITSDNSISKITSDYDGLTLAKAIFKANKTRRDQFLANEYPFTNYNTCSIINCSKIDNLKTAISNFANYVKNADSTDKEYVRNATKNAIIDYAENSEVIDTYENIKDYYGLVDENLQQYVKYKPFGEIYSPRYLKGKIGDVAYTFSYSYFCVTDLGFIMQKIISSSSGELKTKAENVYDALKDVVPEDCYYGTEKISLLDFLPFGYHKYSNGLSIGWFSYDKNDSILNNLNKVDNCNSFSDFVKSMKDKYVDDQRYRIQFYIDCPEWIEMQDSLYQ